MEALGAQSLRRRIKQRAAIPLARSSHGVSDMDNYRSESPTLFPVLEGADVDEWSLTESIEELAVAAPSPIEPAPPSTLPVRVETYSMNWDSRRPRNCE